MSGEESSTLTGAGTEESVRKVTSRVRKRKPLFVKEGCWASFFNFFLKEIGLGCTLELGLGFLFGLIPNGDKIFTELMRLIYLLWWPQIIEETTSTREMVLYSIVI